MGRERGRGGKQVARAAETSGRGASALLVGSATARALVRIAGPDGRSEFDIYDEYMTTVGGFVPIPNPKGDVALNLAALKKAGLLQEQKGVVTATAEALAQVSRVPADDLTAEMVQTPGFRMLVTDAAMAQGLAIACCSTSTSCKCSSSSCSSSIKLELPDIF